MSNLYTADYEGEPRDKVRAMNRLLSEMNGVENREAAFICCMVLAWPDGHKETFTGSVEGTIAPSIRGDKGFGFDGVFIPNGDTRTYAEISPAEKAATSHRTRAFEALVKGAFAASAEKKALQPRPAP